MPGSGADGAALSYGVRINRIALSHDRGHQSCALVRRVCRDNRQLVIVLTRLESNGPPH